ncbi:C6 transcription factor [Pleurostoma richardsiae]|uniref:C6 transcription factor n=1 Tax=Pleurostoma richardsiae TaxID=41990 RepID=A0AA38R543_9PEZI|nr:C6 transcription factor [Pleurostoma richardsiae]
MDATETPFPDLIGSSDDDASHVIGPDLSKDTEVLANYLPGKACISRGALAGAPGQHGLRATPAGVLFTTVRRKPIGLTVDQPTTFRKCEIIEKLVEPFATDLVNMYFEKVNQCFPLLDEASFMRQYAHDKGKLSSALLACLYAQCMTFWRHSGVLSQRHRPDPRFVWNQATEAMYSELHVSPGMSTIISLLLNLNGRPLTTMVGNGVQLASAVSIAHSLGLNRNPSDWDIPQGEKSTRIRLWWALFVLDKWSSLAYGTPPHLKRGQHDVVRPTLEAFCGQPASMQSKSASVFRALVSLTEVLDTYLEHAYRLGPHEDRYPATVATEMELQLNQWEDSLEDGLRRVITRGMELVIPGSANLRLAYLYMKLLLTRLQLDLQKQHDVPNNSLLTNRYAQVRRAAEEIVLLIQGLNESHLCDFWLPLSAFTLSSTVTFLLRCALETEHSSLGLAQSMSLKLANDMIIALRGHRQTCEWDIGDICLVQYGKIVEDLSTSCSSNADDSLDIHGLREAMITHVQDIDELFPSLWDMFNGTSESL